MLTCPNCDYDDDDDDAITGGAAVKKKITQRPSGSYRSVLAGRLSTGVTFEWQWMPNQRSVRASGARLHSASSSRHMTALPGEW